jgi:CRISPR/Cas system Type II protein with McrA/HNH and RuvC-like nuclease domain
MTQADIHVDHVLPRQVVFHDEIWNLVLCHSTCNLLKSDKLVAEHYVMKLVARNENIMGSNHPWKHKISGQLGARSQDRSATLRRHYKNSRAVLGPYYWGGTQGYTPANDPFYRRLITRLNNQGITP